MREVVASPPVQFRPRRGGLVLVHSVRRAGKDFAVRVSSVMTFVAPRALSSVVSSAASAGGRDRTTAMLLRFQSLESWITARPTPLLAPFWITQSPGLRWTKSLSRRQAVTGFTDTVATCEAVRPVLSTRTTADSSTCRCVRHVPSPPRRGITQSPGAAVLTLEPAAITSKQASLPGTALGAGVESAVVKGGRVG